MSRSWPSDGLARIGRTALSVAAGRLIFADAVLDRRDTEDMARKAFVGRTREMGGLEQALTAAAAGKGSAVLVAGEGGIGKTRPVRAPLDSRSWSGAASISSGPSSRTSRSSRRCAR
jgi:hypothetical protein